MSEAAEESDSESQLSETADEKRERLLRRRRWRRQRQRVVKSRRLTSAVLLLSTCSTTTTTAPTYKHTYIERAGQREREAHIQYICTWLYSGLFAESTTANCSANRHSWVVVAIAVLLSYAQNESPPPQPTSKRGRESGRGRAQAGRQATERSRQTYWLAALPRRRPINSRRSTERFIVASKHCWDTHIEK